MSFVLDPTVQNSVLGLLVLNQDVTASSLLQEKRGIYYSRLFEKPDNHVWYQIAMTDNLSTVNFENVSIDTRYRTGNGLPYNTSTGQDYTFDEFNALIKSSNPDSIDTRLCKWNLGRSMLGVSGTSIQMSEQLNVVLEQGTATNSTKLYPNNLVKNETHIVASGNPCTVALNNDFILSSVRVSGFSYTTGTPQQGQYRLVGQGPQAYLLVFNPKDIGKTADVWYEKEPKPVWNYWGVPNLYEKFYIAHNIDHKYIQLRIDMTSLDRVSPVEVYKITISSILKKQ